MTKKQTTPGPPVHFCWAASAGQALELGAAVFKLDVDEVWVKAIGLTDGRRVRRTRYAVRPLAGGSGSPIDEAIARTK